MERPRFCRTVVVLTTILVLACSPLLGESMASVRQPVNRNVIAGNGDSQQIYHGGTVDRIAVTEYASLAEALAAINSGEADLFGQRINVSDYGAVGTYGNLELQWAYDTLACVLALNCYASPLNDSHLRRAIAFAVDKLHIASAAMLGDVDVVDFALPLCNEFSTEKNEGGLFYDANVTSATNELALAGMVDVDNDSMVEAPNGTEISFTLWYPSDVRGLNETAASISADLLSAGINNTLVQMPYTILQNRICVHDLSYNMALYDQDMDDYGFQWVASTFLNANRQVNGENIANIDDYRLNQIATDYNGNIILDEAGTIGLNAVRAVRDLCPIIPLFTYRWLSVYSEARFQGWVNDTNAGAFGAWNPVSVTARPGMQNELRVAVLPSFFDDFFSSLNPFRGGTILGEQWVSKHFFNPYLLVYDSSLETATDGRAVPRLATSWEMLFLGLVPDLTASQSRAQYYIDPNANWTDGVPMDAQDYRFTFEYYATNNLTAYSNLIAGVKTLGDYVAGINYGALDMFSYRILGDLPVLPRHIWESRDPFTWEPGASDVVGSGPFRVFSFLAHSSLVLTINSEYYPVLDTEPPKLKSIDIIPDSPTPAETVVLRAHIYDRSKLRNVTLHYTYHVGSINFSYGTEMELGPLGYEATITAKATATTIYYEVNATDIWGNSAIVAYGSYSRPTTMPPFWQTVTPYLAAAVIIGILVILAGLLRTRK